METHYLGTDEPVFGRGCDEGGEAVVPDAGGDSDPSSAVPGTLTYPDGSTPANTAFGGDEQRLENVRRYYGRVLKNNEDLRTSGRCASETPPAHLRDLINNVHPAVRDKFYGCGSPIPMAIEGRTILDLGCGSGRDDYVLSQLVGAEGEVIGVDMTEEQLATANRHVGWHMSKFGYDRSNISFRRGYIEDLSSVDIADGTVDLVISNCVINLSPNKEAVFREIFRVLKPGGELFFSDVFAGRRVPAALQEDPMLIGECLGGAMYFEDFRRMLAGIGIPDCRVAGRRRLVLDDPEIEQKAGMIDFYSVTVRAFKVPLEDMCENYGHVATYKGSLPESPHAFELDEDHRFQAGLPTLVCGNTANMLTRSRFRAHFDVVGDFSTHFGPFASGSQVSPSAVDVTGGSCC